MGNDPFNRKQKIVLGLIIIAVVSCLLFPPWLFVLAFPGGQKTFIAGYSIIFFPPESNHLGTSIDFSRLIIQLTIIGIIGAVMYYLASKNSKQDS